MSLACRREARASGFESYQVDGMNALATYLAMNVALERMRSGEGPTLVEAEVYRYFHQNGPFPGSAFGYRTKEEEQAWRERDPLRQVSSHLLRRSILSEQALEGTVERAKDLMREIGSLLLEPVPGSKPGQRRIKPAEWPDPTFVNVGVRGDLREFDDAPLADRDDFAGRLTEMKFIDAVVRCHGAPNGHRRRASWSWARTCTT